MKEAWIAPKTEVQRFMANEYVAACGVNEKGKYLFKCDADAGILTVNGYIAGLFTPCNATHEADSLADFTNGYVTNFGGSQNVIVWAGQHATKNLDYKTWTEPQVRS